MSKVDSLIDSVISGENPGVIVEGSLTEEDLSKTIQDTVSKYGWTSKEVGSDFELYNRKGTKVVLVKPKGSKYTMFDMGGNKLMSGNGVIAQSLDKLLTQHYYASPI